MKTLALIAVLLALSGCAGTAATTAASASASKCDWIPDAGGPRWTCPDVITGAAPHR